MRSNPMGLKIYRGPDDDTPNLPEPRETRPPWWLGRSHLTVGQFLSGLGAKGFIPAGWGRRVKSWAKRAGRDGEAVPVPSGEFEGRPMNTWPVALLLDYFGGQRVGGVLIDSGRYRDMTPPAVRPAA